jgi:hypothetical protein
MVWGGQPTLESSRVYVTARGRGRDEGGKEVVLQGPTNGGGKSSRARMQWRDRRHATWMSIGFGVADLHFRVDQDGQ